MPTDSNLTDVADSDQDLLRRFFAGYDCEAMERLFNRHAGTAFRIALREMRNSADAEEVVQTAFLNVLTKGDANVSNVRGWMMGIVVNACRDRIREEARRRQRHEAGALDRPTEEADAEKAELTTAALRMVKSLPEHYRLPVSLHFLEGMSFKEIACALALPEDTVSKQARRGIEQIRQSLTAAGFTASIVAIPDLLSSSPLTAAPLALTASFKAMITSGAARGSGIAAGGTSVTAKGTVAAKSTKVAITAWLLLTAMIAIVAAVHFGGGRNETKEDAGGNGEKPDSKKDEARPFIAKGAKLAGSAQLPGKPFDTRGINYYSWSFDDSKLLFYVNVAPKGQTQCDVFTFTIQSGKLEKIFTLPAGGYPFAVKWLAGDRILVQTSDYQLHIYGTDGRSQDVRLDEGHPSNWLAPSADGKHVAFNNYFDDVKNFFDQQVKSSMYLLTAEDGSVCKLPSPVNSGDPALKTVHRVVGWNSDGKLEVATGTGKTVGYPDSTPDAWTYDVKSGTYGKAGQELVMGQAPQASKFGKDSVWRMPGGKKLRRVINDNKDSKSKSATALEILDDNDKVVRRVNFDPKAVGENDVWPREISADGRFLLTMIFHEYAKELGKGQPATIWPASPKFALLDMDSGKFDLGFDSGTIDLAYKDIWILSQTREVIVIDPDSSERPYSKTFVSIGFDGKVTDLRKELGLSEHWHANFSDVSYSKDFIEPYTRRVGNNPVNSDRFVLEACDKGAPEPIKLLLFWNSTQPIRLWSTQSQTQWSADITWSHNGRLFAVTVGNQLYVWLPTEKPSDNTPISTKGDSDF